MGKIKWDDYRKEILDLYRELKSSDKVADALAVKYGDKFKGRGRGIRAHTEKWGLNKDTLKVGTTPAKILLFDLETAPIKGYLWSKWQKGISDDMIITDWFILTWSAKWLFSDTIIQHKVTGEEALVGDDERIVRELWKVIDEADIIIAHNLEKFDKKKANTRFLKYDLKLPSPYESIDTLLHARKKFAITSNRLDYIAKNFLGIEGKMDTPKGLWWKAMEGDEESLQIMADYCDQDIAVLEDVYLWLRPYIQPHPNIGLYIEEDVHSCPSCGGTDLHHIGDYHTTVNIYDSYRCNDCGALSRSRQTSTPIKTNRNLKSSLPK